MHKINDIFNEDTGIWDDIKYFFKRLTYPFRSRFFTKSYMIDSGLSRWHWHDKSDVLEECMFRTVVDYIEKEKCFEYIDYDAEPEAKKFLNDTYNFYIKRLPKMKRLCSKFLHRAFPHTNEWINELRNAEPNENGFYPMPEIKSNEKYHDLLNKLETQIDREIDEHLLNIVKFHRILWT